MRDYQKFIVLLAPLNSSTIAKYRTRGVGFTHLIEAQHFIVFNQRESSLSLPPFILHMIATLLQLSTTTRLLPRVLTVSTSGLPTTKLNDGRCVFDFLLNSSVLNYSTLFRVHNDEASDLELRKQLISQIMSRLGVENKHASPIAINEIGVAGASKQRFISVAHENFIFTLIAFICITRRYSNEMVVDT